MKNDKLKNRIAQGIHDACYIWKQELMGVLKDEGVLIFFIIVPLLYPLLYSWIYNNEVARDVPVVVIDDSRSAISRKLVRMCDASPDVAVTHYAHDMDEAKLMVSRQEARGILWIPSDFATRINRGEQAALGVYCDMSVMLHYKAIYQTATAVTQKMNSDIQIKLAANHTDREDQITTAPLQFDEVAVYNPAGGYGSFIIPGVLMLILQQTLVLGIGLSAGTAREKNRYGELIPISHHYQGVFRIVLGKSLCYFMIYAIVAAYLTLIVPRIFSFVALGGAYELAMIMFPYLLACIFFGMTVSCMVRYRENVMLLVVFVSVPLLFVSGVSWPQSDMPGVWQSVSWLFPSTFGIRAFVRVNSMGASLPDVITEYQALWLQAAAYFFLACIVYKNQIKTSRLHALERLAFLKKKRVVKRQIKNIRTKGR